jgi:hypothetical protein
MTEEQLETTIAALVARKKNASDAERAMLDRVLNGLRYKYEEAGGIWEQHDPFGWGATPP